MENTNQYENCSCVLQRKMKTNHCVGSREEKKNVKKKKRFSRASHERFRQPSDIRYNAEMPPLYFALQNTLLFILKIKKTKQEHLKTHTQYVAIDSFAFHWRKMHVIFFIYMDYWHLPPSKRVFSKSGYLHRWWEGVRWASSNSHCQLSVEVWINNKPSWHQWPMC